MNAAAVITSIYPPTGAVAEWVRRSGWKVTVVGDEKTPSNWQLSNCRFIGREHQTSEFAQALPTNHYVRKMLGYLAAVADGATVILDTDDDNYPEPGWRPDQSFFQASCQVVSSGFLGWLNVHALFDHATSWPRGFPLEYILANPAVRQKDSAATVGVWQGLVAGDPDVDAIYRLTRHDMPAFSAGAYVLDYGTACPFNSQNTLFRHELFPLLYLPSVSFRFTDILRSFVAQPLMWAMGYHVGFVGPNARQCRNDHRLVDDFLSEAQIYYHGKTVLDAVKLAVDQLGDELSLGDRLVQVYEMLARGGVVDSDEPRKVKLWLAALEAASTSTPAI